MSYTYVTLGVSQAAYDEIAEKLRVAEYHHAFDGPLINMHGIALEPPAEAQRKAGEPLHVAGSAWARLQRANHLLRELVRAVEETDNPSCLGLGRDSDEMIAARKYLETNREPVESDPRATAAEARRLQTAARQTLQGLVRNPHLASKKNLLGVLGAVEAVYSYLECESPR